MKNKKITNNFFCVLPDFSNEKDHAPIAKALFVFMIFIFIVYGGLFYLYGKKVVDETGNFEPTKGASAMEMKFRKMVKGHPISEMAPYIAQRDKKTAGFLMAIAKKESNWGKYSPKKGKKECYNYWGYRGTYKPTVSGYSCFDSEKQAVEVVGKRIDELISQGTDTPEKMIVWKCGENCSEHSSQSVQKWIADVSFYYNKI